MIWKGCLVLSVALCVLCEKPPAYSEVTVKKYYKDRPREVTKSDHRPTENHEEYAKSHPSYEFSYKVIDPHTHDKKGQQETRDGDKVTGHYWLIQPDGHKRLIKYNVDGKHGFTADVNYALHDPRKDDIKDNNHKPEHESEEHKKENDREGDDKSQDKIKEEIKEDRHEDKEPENISEEFESKKIDEGEERKQIDEKPVEEDKKDNEKNDEPPKVHVKEENDNNNEHEHKKDRERPDLWSQIRNWGKLENEDKRDDDWNKPKLYTWSGAEDKEDKKHELHEEHDKNEGNVWSWRKSYDVWEVNRKDGERQDENDNNNEPIREEQREKRPEDDGGKKKGRRRNVGLRDYEYRGQPTYHMPIMKTKPIPYRRRIIVN